MAVLDHLFKRRGKIIFNMEERKNGLFCRTIRHGQKLEGKRNRISCLQKHFATLVCCCSEIEAATPIQINCHLRYSPEFVSSGERERKCEQKKLRLPQKATMLHIFENTHQIMNKGIYFEKIHFSDCGKTLLMIKDKIFGCGQNIWSKVGTSPAGVHHLLNGIDIHQ